MSHMTYITFYEIDNKTYAWITMMKMVHSPLPALLAGTFNYPQHKNPELAQ